MNLSRDIGGNEAISISDSDVNVLFVIGGHFDPMSPRVPVFLGDGC